MSLKQKLTDLTAAIADKTNELHGLAEMKSNKQQDLSSTNTDHYPSVPAVKTGLEGKVDKITGKGLSEEDFTTALKDKLAGLESSKFRGKFTGTDESVLPTTGNSEGSYADLDTSTAGEPTKRYIWDVNDEEWIEQVGASTDLTASEIKQLYESNADTNAFTDALEAKLISLENYDDSSLSGRVTTAEGDINSLETDVSNIDSRVSTNEGNISTLQTNVSTNAQGVTDLESELTTYYKSLGTAFPDYEAQYLAELNY